MQDRDLKNINEANKSFLCKTFWQVDRLENLLMNISWGALNFSYNKWKKNTGAGLEYMHVSLQRSCKLMLDFYDEENCLCCCKKNDFNTSQKSAGMQEHKTEM